MNEHVVLVDSNNNPIGTADKYEVHRADTPLHRGFSLFIVNSNGEVILQQRSKHKKTWPNVWSNSVCGHPANGETPQQAAIRRAKYELGIELNNDDVKLVLPDYKYRYSHKGVVENEFCPVMVAFVDVEAIPNSLEVADTRLVDWNDFMGEINRPNSYSEWCQEEAKLLDSNFLFKQLFKSHANVSK
jgi:isopentenyl-diphosphate delta-isomerase